MKWTKVFFFGFRCVFLTKKRHWLISLCDIFTSCYTRKRVRPLSFFFSCFFSLLFYVFLEYSFIYSCIIFSIYFLSFTMLKPKKMSLYSRSLFFAQVTITIAITFIDDESDGNGDNNNQYTLPFSLIQFKWKANNTINFVNEQKCTNYHLMARHNGNDTH